MPEQTSNDSLKFLSLFRLNTMVTVVPMNKYQYYQIVST